jgi:hypothetical protein
MMPQILHASESAAGPKISSAAIARGVSRALRLELETYPKPGLVSRIDNGRQSP